MNHINYPLTAFLLAIAGVPSLHAAGEEPSPAPTDSVPTQQVPADSIKSTALDEVVVTRELTKHEGNKDIITITKAMREGTKDAGELLGRVPGVFYNPISTELLYQGMKNVLILVDGVEKEPTYIKRLNPGRFDRITVISNPTGIYASYDAVIDLRTKLHYTGYEGAVIGETKVLPDNRNGRGNNPSDVRAEGQFTYTRDKFNVDFYTSYKYMRRGLEINSRTSYPLNGIYETTIPSEKDEPNRRIIGSSYSASLAGDYQITSNHSLSARISAAPSSNRERTDAMLERINTLRQTTQTISMTDINRTRDRLDLSGGLWYRGVAGKWGLKANLSYTDVSYQRVSIKRRSTGYELDDRRNVHAPYWSAAAEAGRTLWPKWYLSLSDRFTSAGYSERREETGNLLSRTTDLRNTLEASLSWFPNKKASLSVNAGVSVFSNRYNDLRSTHVSPRAGLQASWQPSSKAFLRLDYRLSSQVPGVASIQDYGQFTDSLVYTCGNPLLRPVLNHSVSLTAMLFQRLSLETRYTHATDALYAYYDTATGMIPSGVEAPYVYVSPVNGSGDTWNLNLTYTDRFGPHWMVSVSAEAKYSHARFGHSSNHRILPSYSWYAMYQTWANTMQIYLSGGMNPTMTLTPQWNQWNLEDFYALTISKTFLKNSLLLQAMWIMPLHLTSGRWRGGLDSEAYRIEDFGNNQFRHNNWLTFTVLYRFQGGKSVRRYNRQSESVEI